MAAFYEMKTCFFGCQLKTGAFFISFFTLIAAVSGVIFAVVNISDTYLNFERSYQDRYFPGPPYTMTQDHVDRFARLKYKLYMGYGTLLFFSFMTTLLSGTCLAGVTKKNYRHMKPGLFALRIFVLVFGLISFANAWDSGLRRDEFRQMFSAFVFFYCYFVLYNHYKELLMGPRNIPYTLSRQILTQDMIINKDNPVKPNPAATDVGNV